MMSNIIWLFGRSGAGKTTLGERLAKDLGYLFLDADRVRKVLHIQPDFTRKGRVMFQDALRYHVRELQWRGFGNNMVVASITPLQEMRNLNRVILNNYMEVYIACPTDILIERDPKGLYAGAARGEIYNMFLFEEPFPDLEGFGENSLPDTVIPTDVCDEDMAFHILWNAVEDFLEEHKVSTAPD